MAAASVAVMTGSRAPRHAPNHTIEGNTVVYLTYTPNTSYSTGGDAIDIAAALPFQVRGKPVTVEFITNETTLGYAFAYDRTNKKILIWNGTTQFSNASDASAIKPVLKVTVS